MFCVFYHNFQKNNEQENLKVIIQCLKVTEIETLDFAGNLSSVLNDRMFLK